MNSIAKLRAWIGESVSRRLAIPGLVLILLLLVQAALSSGSAWLLVGRLEESSYNSDASMKLTGRLLSAAQELSDHARATVAATDDTQRTDSIAAFNETKARLGEVVDEISTKLSSDPSLAAGGQRRPVDVRRQRRQGDAGSRRKDASKMRSASCRSPSTRIFLPTSSPPSRR